MYLKIISLVVLFLITACSSSMPTTIIPSTSPLAAGTRGTIEAYGSDCQYYFLGLIPITTTANSQAALDEAKESANADVLTDVTIDHGGAYYILFSNNCIRVRGKGVPREITNHSEIKEQSLL